jgi:TRAP-type C4-dicarboxylate transport system substrate-binding protein
MTPLTNAITLPGLSFKTAEKGSEILWRLYETYPQIRDEFKENHILLLYTSNPYILITAKKPVRTLEDLKGMKIRMPKGPPLEQVKALGGIPALFPMPKNYDLLSSGIIDGMGAPWEAIHGYKLYEVVKYYTEVPFSAVFFSIAMNKKRWESLPPDIQKAIQSVSAMEGSKFWGKHFFDSARDAVHDQIKETTGKEIDYYVLPEAERSRWLEISGKPIWQDWTVRMKQQGYFVAPEILDTLVGN